MSIPKLDQTLAKKAVKALFDHEEKKSKSKNTLVSEYAKPILAAVQLTSEIKKPVVRPVRVKIPNTLFSKDVEDHSVCLFCRSEDKDALEKYLKAMA